MSKHSPGRHSSLRAERRDRVTPAPEKGKTKYMLIIFLCALVCGLAAAAMGVYFGSRWYAREEYAILSESVRFSPKPMEELVRETDESAEPVAIEEVTAEVELAEIPVDLPYLQSLNSEVEGWICVEGTDIDYPVLYDSTGEDYYLDHTLSGAYSSSGAIFVQNLNNRGFGDFNTVVYGHNMRDSSMFAQLHRFEREEFFDSHDIIVVYMNDRILTYRIFAAYVRNADNILASGSYDTEVERRAYIEEIHTFDGNFRGDVEVTSEDRIITLSTCTGWTNTRLVVQGVLISEEPGVCISSE